MKEIFPKKYRYFIWAIVAILVAGTSLLAYVYIVGLQLESETLNQSLVAPQKKEVSVEQAETELGSEVSDLSSEISNLEELANQIDQTEKELEMFSF